MSYFGADGYWSFNDSEIYPLVAGAAPNGTALLAVADPTHYHLANFMQSMFNNNINANSRFQQECAAVGLTASKIPNFVDGKAVAETIYHPIYDTLLKENTYKFPLLSVHPDEEAPTQITLARNGFTRDFIISWVLPPLTSTQFNRMMPFFNLAGKSFLVYAYNGYDPKDGYYNQPDLRIWKLANVGYVTIGNIQRKPYLGMDKKQNAYFPSIQMKLTVVEVEFRPVIPNFDPFNEIDIKQYLDGYPAAPFIEGIIK